MKQQNYCCSHTTLNVCPFEFVITPSMTYFLTLTLFGRFPAMIVEYQRESDFKWVILGDPRLNFVNLRHVYPPQA